MLVGDGWHDHGLVFTKVDGEPLYPEIETLNPGSNLLALVER
jgi:hypothetical protein